MCGDAAETFPKDLVDAMRMVIRLGNHARACGPYRSDTRPSRWARLYLGAQSPSTTAIVSSNAGA